MNVIELMLRSFRINISESRSFEFGSLSFFTLMIFFATGGLTFAGEPEAPVKTEVPPDQLETPYRIEVVAEDLRVPWEMMFLPDGRMMFTERTGSVRIIKDDQLLPEPALELDVAQGNKMGLLGIVADPNFAENRQVTLAYNYRTNAPNEGRPDFRLRVVRYREDNNRLVDPEVLVEDIPAASNHTGCRLVFGPDGKLYVTTGDADRPEPSQNLGQLHGKILRLEPDGSIPADNPFIGVSGARPEIWSYGHRNPQGLAFQPRTGALLSSEHGPNGGDELNWITRRANYGWPVVSHRRTQDGMEPPFLEFTPSIAPGKTIFYSGKAFPELAGDALVSCLRGQSLLRVQLDGQTLRSFSALFRGNFGRVRDVVESPEGYLYVSTSQQDPPEGRPLPGYDRILRIVPASAPASAFPEWKPEPPGAFSPSPAVTAIEKLIRANCASCHGAGLSGGLHSSLLDGQWEHATDDTSLSRIIAEGLPEHGMPAPLNPLTPDEVSLIVRYIRDREPEAK